MMMRARVDGHLPIRMAAMPVRAVVASSSVVRGPSVVHLRRRMECMVTTAMSDGRARSRGRRARRHRLVTTVVVVVVMVVVMVAKEAHVSQWAQDGAARGGPVGHVAGTHGAIGVRSRLVTVIMLAVGDVLFAHDAVVWREAWRVLAAARDAARVGCIGVARRGILMA